MMIRRPLLLLFAGAILFAVSSLPASAQAPTGLKGTIVDKDGQPLPTARVTITNAALSVNTAAIADAKGEFRVVPLPPGKGYQIEVAFPGMSKIVLSDIEIVTGRVTAVPVTLRPGSEMVERMKVTATTDVVNTEQVTTQTNFTSEFIDALPILGRNYQDVLTLAPGVSDDDGDGNVNIHGARDVDVVTLVDGVSTVDPYTGKVGQQLNIDSIQEIEVKTSGADASFGRAQGGFVNVITKSGGNEFEGNFKFFWRSNILDGDGAGIDDPKLHGGLGELGLRDLKFNDFTPFLSLGGPIKKDKAWYFFTGEYIQIQEPVNALTQAFVRSTKEVRLFGKVSWDMSTNHKLVFTATVDPQTYDNQGIDSFTNLESGWTDKEGGLNLTLKETAVFSPNVFLESTLQHFSNNPRVIPTLDPDTNGNGILFIDRDNNGFIDASERDPGEDFDRDGKFDVFEDVNGNGILDATSGEDRDLDMRLTPSSRDGVGGGCEGATREDVDCDGNPDWRNEDKNGNGIWEPDPEHGEDFDGDRHFDVIEEDLNQNGVLDEGEDTNENRHLDTSIKACAEPTPACQMIVYQAYIEDRNRNRELDDRPVVAPGDSFPDGIPPGSAIPEPYTYPYGHQTPISPDSDYSEDQNTLRVTGPYNFTQDATGSRISLREDLTLFVPDWNGQHDMRFGGVIEREGFNRDSLARPQIFPHAKPPTAGSVFLPTIGAQVYTSIEATNEATSTSFGVYVQDTYKPMPNLTLVVGVRFDREATDSYGYTPFDPVAQRELYDKVWNLGGGERGQEDATVGNNDGLQSQGWCSDPLFRDYSNACSADNFTDQNDEILSNLSELKRIATSRLTQHHYAAALAADSLAALFPRAVVTDPVTGQKYIDREILRTLGAATFQEREAFRLTNNNFAPRLAISWDPWADSKTKVFANWSRYYDKLFLNAVTLEEGPDPIFRYYIKDSVGVTASGIPTNGIGAPITKAPPDAYQIDRGLQTPFSDEFTMGFEREIAPEVSLRITYINRKYRQQLQDRDINHSIRRGGADNHVLDQIGTTVPGGSGGAASRNPDFYPDLYIHNFFFNGIYRLGNYNDAKYSGLEFQVSKRLSRKWQMDASYTYARAIGSAEDFTSTLGDDPASQGWEYGYLNYDQRHSIKFNAVTYLPKDWQIGGAIGWSSGYPYAAISTFLATDNYDYPHSRTLFGYIPPNVQDDPEIPGQKKYVFRFERRNSRRNQPILNIDLNAQKAFVLGKLNSKVFFTVANLLNTDHLRIHTFEPTAPDRGGALQTDAERDFGRRFEVGFQLEF